MKPSVLSTTRISVLLLGLLAPAFSLWPTPEQRSWMTHEHGPIEVTTAWLLAGLALVLPFAFRAWPRSAWAWSGIAWIGAIREAGWHKSDAGLSLYRSSLYVSPDVPVAVKGASAALVVLLVSALVWCTAQGLRWLQTQPWQRPTDTLFLGAVLLLVISQLIDRIAPLFDDKTVQGVPLELTEELLELFFVGLLWAGAWGLWRRLRHV